MGPAQAALYAPFSLIGETFEFLPAGEITHELAGRGIGTVTLVPTRRRRDSQLAGRWIACGSTLRNRRPNRRRWCCSAPALSGHSGRGDRGSQACRIR